MIKRMLSVWEGTRLGWILPGLFAVIIFLLLTSGEPSYQANLVAVEGDLADDQRQDVYQRLIKIAGQKQSLQQIKTTLEEVDWIHRVEIRKSWPDRLMVLVIEETPIAYWNNDAFINLDGKVFVSSFEIGGDLAQLYGPVGSEKSVMQQYQQLNNALLKSSQSIDVLTLDDRGGWDFTNDVGVQVLLGKDDIMERIQRYLLIVENGGLATYMDNINLIDARYSNGLAVSWKSSEKDLAFMTNYKNQRELRL